MSDLTVLVEGPLAHVEVVWMPEEEARISAAAQEQIDRRWGAYVADAVAKGRSLFNGTITRLIRAEAIEAGVRLTLGPTDYKTFLVTVMRDRAWFLEHAPEVMAFGLGNSVLMTHGNQAILGIRSPETSAYAGRAHVLGGVLERLGSAALSVDMEGILTHLRREMQEEAAVGAGDLASQPQLLAVVKDGFLCQPELVWQWEMTDDLRQIADRLDAHEHHGAVIIEKDGIAAATYELMTPVARAAWERWRSR